MGWAVNKDLLCFLLLNVVISNVAAQVFSCGGFVKSAVPIDFSKLKVKLLTPEGHLKHEEELNPQNGYFMIPVYNKGQYSLRVASPEGYYFDPEIFSFKLDGETDPCTKNKDIIFNLKSFSVSGVVDGAVAGLPLVLTKNGEKVDTTLTEEGGKYKMKAPPGKYEVSTGPGASKCISRGKSTVEVSNGPVVVLPNLKISGHQLSVSVTKGATGVEGIPITLYSSSQIEFPNCKKLSSRDKDAPTGAQFECSLGKTGKDGKIEISCFPSGKYQIRPHSKSADTWLSFSPALQTIDLQNNNGKVEFEVSSLGIRGKIAVGAKGLADTENLKEGKIELSAKAPNTVFESKSVNINFKNPSLPVVSVQKFEVCGSVENDGSNNELVMKKDGETISIRPDSNGKFCEAVEPGFYTITPADAGSSLTPRSLGIDVSEKPVTGIRFTNFKTDAEVRVSCIGACPTATVVLSLNGNDVRKSEGTDVFTFEGIGPGSYKARIDDGGRGCWQKKEVDLIVERQRPAPAQLVQNGFSTRLFISHDAKLTWTHSEKKQIRGELAAKGGEVQLCLPAQARYQISLDSCFTFEKQQFEISVPTDSVIEKKAVAARISGHVKSSEKPSMTVKIRSSAGEREVTVKNGVYSFDEPLSSSGDELLMVPTSQTHLFEPASSRVIFDGKCHDNIVTFAAVKGIFVDGTIQPPVANVNVKVTKKSDPNVVFNVVSDAKGKYRFGPVKDANEYKIEASLDGYKFNANPKKHGAFDSVKLSQLSISVVDEKTKKPLEDVLLSLVGSGDYRSNNMLDSTAQINFVGLAPGDYYVRAILQEYKFLPTTTTIKMQEGKHETIVLEGRRVSYSTFGKIREMSGTPVQGVVVEALSEKCDQHQSEATSGPQGTFRIRGLLPNCLYKIYAKSMSDGSSAPHSFPSHFNVDMTADDVKKLDFIATALDQTTDVAVEIDMSALRDIQSVKLSVSKGHEHLRTSVLQHPVHLFYISQIERDGSEYSVRVEPDRPPQAFPAKTVFFSADAPVRVVRVPLTSSRKAGEIEISLSNFLALPFFVLLLLAFFNKNRTLELLQSLQEFFIQNTQNAAQKETEIGKKRNEF
ncbi:unnamed protein product [Caenorhabditis auriculariae]|uniref:Uncharacterized protein n=1 Tax=Caenorhabditis auriculariae TaxID=2777116 RepID=A0A8S1HTB8_9PELO|nr:unnamed protein product [Caenorhabditis auriculariae]